MSNNDLLFRALRLNALFSGISALLLLAAAPWLATQLGLGSAMPVYVTAGLLGLFALQLAHIVRTRQIRVAEIVGIIGGDFAWVIGSAVFVALFYASMTLIGLVLVDAVALAVLYFAIQQIRGLRAAGLIPAKHQGRFR